MRVKTLERKRIGIYGGSFNPVHNAHIALALHFFDEMKLDDLYFVPAYVSPFKAGEPLDPAGVGACHDCTPRQRLDMLQLATRHHAGFHVDDFEIVRGEVSYTIDTVDYFSEKFPGSLLFLLVGADQALHFTEWKQYRQILGRVQLCVAPRRAGTEADLLPLDGREVLGVRGVAVHFLNTPLMDVSSTEIRRRISRGEPVDFFVDPQVAAYIYQNKLYICKS